MKKEDQFAINELDLSEAMEKLKANDPELTSLNLNNHKDVTPDILSEVADCVVNNPHLKELLLANTRMNDTSGMVCVCFHQIPVPSKNNFTLLYYFPQT